MTASASQREHLEPTPGMLRGFILLRVIVVSTLLVSALLIQLTFSISLPLKPIYYLAAFAYALSIGAASTLHLFRAEAHLALQVLGDLAVITGIVYISRGPDSAFTFLYLAVVAAGASLLGRRGGLIAAGLATVFYAVLVDLMYQNVLPTIEYDDLPPRVFTRAGLFGNVALNGFAFVATALLVAAASERLREARADSDRRRAEIARLQALHSSVLASMSSGVVTTDLSGLVTYVNPPGADILHATVRELLGRPLTDLGLVDEAAWSRIRAADTEILRFERVQPRGGHDVYFGISVTALRDGDGAPVGRILIFQNLTDLKRLEGEVRLKEKLAAVGELAAAIAHEIRNPLASISGSVQVLRSGASPGSSERRLMDIVVQESHRLSAILEDFLKYVKPRERLPEPVDAAAALRDVTTLLTHSDELSAAHQVAIDIVPESVVLEADPGQLRQIFWNLARNALAAMPEGGLLSVTARLDSGVWSATIRDEGRGMTPEEQGRLFTPFAHSSPGGTGLGLAIVYRIVEEHGGSIRVDSAPGGGTAITITLPARAAAAAPRRTSMREVA